MYVSLHLTFSLIPRAGTGLDGLLLYTAALVQLMSMRARHLLYLFYLPTAYSLPASSARREAQHGSSQPAICHVTPLLSGRSFVGPSCRRPCLAPRCRSMLACMHS